MEITLLLPKDYVVYVWDNPFQNVVKILAWTEDIAGISPEKNVYREFRFSYNNRNWSAWVELKEEKISELYFRDNVNIWFEVKYTRIGIDTKSPIIIRSFDLIPKFSAAVLSSGNTIPKKQSIGCQECVCGGFYTSGQQNYQYNPNTGTMQPQNGCLNSVLPLGGNNSFLSLVIDPNCNDYNPYALAGNAVSTWQNLNQFIVNRWGIPVNYFKVLPQKNTSDVILHEYGTYGNVINKCIKMMVEGNEFPDSKFNFSQFGVDYEGDFEVLIQYEYFQSIFGKDSEGRYLEPDKRDFMIMEINNREYDVTSTYLERSFMQVPAWWKCNLVKRQERINVFLPENMMTYLDQRNISTEEVTEPEVSQTIIDITNPMQLKKETTKQNIMRKKINPNLVIVPEELNNNYTIIADNCYDLSSVYQQYLDPQIALEYTQTPTMSVSEDLTFTTWFRTLDVSKYKLNEYRKDKIKNWYYDNVKKRVYVELNGKGRLADGQTFSIKGSGSLDGFHKIKKESESSFSFESLVEVPPTIVYTTVITQIHPIVLFDGYDPEKNEGWRIELIERRYFYIFINSVLHIYDIGLEIKPEIQWLAVVVQISNTTKDLELTLWRKSAYASANPNVQNTNLSQVFSEVRNIGEIGFDLSDRGFMLTGSPHKQTCIRLFTERIEKEKQSLMLNTAIIKEAHLALINDSCIPVENFPKFNRNF